MDSDPPDLDPDLDPVLEVHPIGRKLLNVLIFLVWKVNLKM